MKEAYGGSAGHFGIVFVAMGTTAGKPYRGIWRKKRKPGKLGRKQFNLFYVYTDCKSYSSTVNHSFLLIPTSN